MTTVTNLLVPQGSTFSHRFLHKNEDGSVFSLAGYTARLSVARLNHDGTYGKVIIALDHTNGLTMDGAAGQITLNLTPAHTSVVHIPGTELVCAYQLEVTSGATTYRSFMGVWKLTKEIVV